MRMWTCCGKLFFLGSLERRDAYSILSLYLSYFSCTETSENSDMSDGVEEFDIRSEKELWNEIKRGLVLDPNFPPVLVDLSLSNK